MPSLEAGVAQRAVAELAHLGDVHPVAAGAALDDARARRAGRVRVAVSAGAALRVDGAPRGHAERQAVAAAWAGDVPLLHALVALGARHHPRGWVLRRVPDEDLDRQGGELVLHLLADIRRGLKLDEGLGALHEELVVVGGQRDDRVDGLGVKDVLVIRQPQCSLHRRLVLALVQLSLRKEEQVEGLAASPGALQRAIGRHALVRRDQRLHRLRSRHGAHRGARHLDVESLGLVLLDLHCGEQVELLDLLRVLLRAAGHIVRDLREELGGLGVPAGLAVQLHGLYLLVLVQEVLRVLRQQALDLLEVLLLCQVDCQIPLVQQHAAVHRRLHVAVSHVGLDGLLAQADGRELVANVR
mmetsp:Transcript_12200/g.31335  ORF Transcript_12200/g.31335 Transcript_12200/m.31335 type:complete len:356 (+) Transcript_12200:202-1269(+)